MTFYQAAEAEDGGFSGLERQLEELISLCERLREENRLLRRQQSAMLQECAALVKNNPLVRNRVEAIVLRLKAME